jgi:hypothetical protein
MVITMKMILPLVLIAGLSVACTDKKKAEEEAQPELTQRQRDSILGESVLPGAQGVRNALEVVDSAAARRAREAGIN